VSGSRGNHGSEHRKRSQWCGASGQNHCNGLNNLRPTTETQSFDKSRAPLSKTELYAPDHAGMTRMYTHYETGMEIEVVTDSGGKQSTTITAPHREPVRVEGTFFFTHPYLTAAGAGGTGVDQAAKDALDPAKAPLKGVDVTGDTERALKNVRVGVRFAGPGLVIAGSLLDLANGASPTKVGAETAATLRGVGLAPRLVG